MPNGLILPDFAGRFNAGRQEAQRNMLLQRTLAQEDADLARQEQTRNLLADFTMPGASPEERAANLNHLMAVNPEAAMAAQTHQNAQATFAQEQAAAERAQQAEQAQQVVRRMQRVLASPNPEISLRVNSKFEDGDLIERLTEMGVIDPSDGIDADEARRIAQLTIDEMAPLAGSLDSDLPASMQTFNALAAAGGLSPEDRQRAARVELGLDPRAAGGGLQTFRMRGGDGVERIYRFNPQSGELETVTDGQWIGASGGARPLGGEAAAENASRSGLFEGRSPEAQAEAGAFSEARTEDLLGAQTRVAAANDVINTVDAQLEPVFERVLANAGVWTVGFGSMMKPPGSPAANMAADLDMLGANAAFDRLQRMRDQSPTGGALGQVSERELDLLRASVAAIAQSQSPEQFRENVKALREHYRRISALAKQSRERDQLQARIAALRQRPQSRETAKQIAELQQRAFAIEDQWWQSLDDAAQPTETTETDGWSVVEET